MAKKQARRMSRTTALRALFAYISRQGSVTPEEALNHVTKDVDEGPADEFASLLLKTTVEHHPKMKVLIKSFAKDFHYEKIAPINRAILLQGLAEMKFFETPPVVVINEYVEIAKMFGEERSAAFVNGVLDAFRINLEARSR